MMLGALATFAIVSGLLIAGAWKYWRKSTIARIAQALALLSIVNIFFGDWEIAVGGFLLYGSFWFLAYRKMNFDEKNDYKTFFRR